MGKNKERAMGKHNGKRKVIQKGKKKGRDVHNNKKKSGLQNLKNIPNSILGMFLSTIPPKVRKYVIWIVTAGVTGGVIILFLQQFFIKNIEIRESLKNEKLEYWQHSEKPEWKIALLNTWNKPSDVPEEIWAKAILDPNTEVLIAMASHPWLPFFYKERLLKNSEVRVRLAVILNSQSKNEIIKKLSIDEEPEIRKLIAKKEYIPLEILNMLVNDNNEFVREVLACNSNL